MKLRFVSAGAAQAAVRAQASRDGIQVEGHFGAVGAMLAKFTAGEPCDILILTRKQIDELARSGPVVAATVTDLGAVPTSIAVRAGDPPPAVGDADSLRAALLAADAIYFPDPANATAGIHFDKVLRDLGIRDRVASRIRNFPNGATAMRAMGEAAGHPICCTQATEIEATPTVRLVAPLPPGFDLVTVYTGAVTQRASDRDAAARFLSSLASSLPGGRW